jgi:hypothetical protein
MDGAPLVVGRDDKRLDLIRLMLYLEQLGWLVVN